MACGGTYGARLRRNCAAICMNVSISSSSRAPLRQRHVLRPSESLARPAGSPTGSSGSTVSTLR